MGCKDFFRVLSDYQVPSPQLKLTELYDNNIKSVAIDGHMILHASLSCCAHEIINNTLGKNYLSYISKKIQPLIDSKVEITIVVDGNPNPIKADEDARRKESRLEKLERLKNVKSTSPEYWNLVRSAASVTPEMINGLCKWCEVNNIRFIRSPYEADPQLAWLNYNNYVDAVIAEDSDLLVYGVSVLIRGFVKPDQYVTLVYFNDIERSLNFGEHDKFKRRFLWFCLFLGHDYLDRIPKFGPKKIISEFSRMVNLDLEDEEIQFKNMLMLASGKKINSNGDEITSTLKFNLPPASESYYDNFANATAAFNLNMIYNFNTKEITKLRKVSDAVGIIQKKYVHLSNIIGSKEVPNGYNNWEEFCECKMEAAPPVAVATPINVKIIKKENPKCVSSKGSKKNVKSVDELFNELSKALQ